MCNCIRHNAFNRVKQMCLCERSKVRLKTLGPVPSVKDRLIPTPSPMCSTQIFYSVFVFCLKTTDLCNNYRMLAEIQEREAKLEKKRNGLTNRSKTWGSNFTRSLSQCSPFTENEFIQVNCKGNPRQKLGKSNHNPLAETRVTLTHLTADAAVCRLCLRSST